MRFYVALALFLAKVILLETTVTAFRYLVLIRRVAFNRIVRADRFLFLIFGQNLLLRPFAQT